MSGINENKYTELQHKLEEVKFEGKIVGLHKGKLTLWVAYLIGVLDGQVDNGNEDDELENLSFPGYDDY